MEVFYDKFDSSIITKPCYKIILGKNYNLKDLQGLEKPCMVKIFTPFILDDVRTLEDNGYALISSRNTYSIDVEKVHLKSFGNSKTNYRVLWGSEFTELPEYSEYSVTLERLSKQSRFFRDDRIGGEIAKEIYKSWFLNYLSGDFGEDSILIYEGDLIIGILCFGISGLSASIDLFVVHPEKQNMGIGKILTSHFFRYCFDNKIKHIVVETESDNIQSNVFYQRRGFLLINHELIYHKHYE